MGFDWAVKTLKRKKRIKRKEVILYERLNIKMGNSQILYEELSHQLGIPNNLCSKQLRTVRT